MFIRTGHRPFSARVFVPRTNARDVIAGLLASTLLAGCAGTAGSLGASGALQTQSARVPIVVGIPADATGVKSVTVSVTRDDGQKTLDTIPCDAATLRCYGIVKAPPGNDSFRFTLPLSPRVIWGEVPKTVTQTTSDPVGVTFNPVVSSVSLALAPNGGRAYLSSGGPKSAPIQVIFTDPAGLRIIGDKPFVSASDSTCQSTVESPCLTVTVSDADAAGVTSLSKTTFTDASSLATNLAIDANASPAPFDIPVVSLSAPSSIPTSAPISVPISPYVTSSMAPQNNAIGGGGVIGSPGMTSLYGNDAMELNAWDGETTYDYDPTIDDITVSILGQDYSICCGYGTFNYSSGDFLDHLLGGIALSSQTGEGTTGDTVLWYADETGQYFSFADITADDAYNEIVPFPSPSTTISSAIVDLVKQNIWFTTYDRQSSSSPIVGVFSGGTPAAGETANTVSLPSNQVDGTVVGLTSVAAGLVDAVVSVPSGSTYVDTLQSSSNGTPSVVSNVKLTSGINLAPNVSAGSYATVGYSPADGMIYASDATGKVYRINPSSGTWTAFAVPSGETPSPSEDPNRPPMALLPDDTLAYLGVPNLIHVVPGSNPTASSVPVACASLPCSWNIWSILSSGSPPHYHMSISSTNGGHTSAMSW